MKAFMISAAVLGLSAPALAAPPAADPAAAPAAASAPMTEPATAAPVTEAAQPAPATADAAAAPTDPAAILKTEFPSYDKDSSGDLNQTEFTTWMTALKAANPQKTAMTPAQETAWLTQSFTDADKDKTKTITLAELTSYLIKA